jgi:hypothetical protein
MGAVGILTKERNVQTDLEKIEAWVKRQEAEARHWIPQNKDDLVVRSHTLLEFINSLKAEKHFPFEVTEKEAVKVDYVEKPQPDGEVMVIRDKKTDLCRFVYAKAGQAVCISESEELLPKAQPDKHIVLKDETTSFNLEDIKKGVMAWEVLQKLASSPFGYRPKIDGEIIHEAIKEVQAKYKGAK